MKNKFEITNDYPSFERNKERLIILLRKYENSDRVQCKESMQFYRLRLQNNGKLTEPMIDHIFKFIWFDLDQPKDQVREILMRFLNPPNKPAKPGITLDQFF